MASRFWVGGAGTWDASTTTPWAATTGGAGGQSVPVSTDDVTFDGASGGGTVTINTNFNIKSITWGAFTGTLDFSVNNNSVTVGTWSGSGSGTRTCKLGSAQVTVTGASGTPWTMQTTTGLTWTPGTSTILFSATPTAQRSITLGNALTYGSITITDSGTTGLPVLLANSNNTMANLSYSGGGGIVSAGGTITITGTLTFNGTSAHQVGYYGNNAVPGISVAGATSIQWAFLQNITKSGAGSITATNSFDGGGNTGITITTPAAMRFQNAMAGNVG